MDEREVKKIISQALRGYIFPNFKFDPKTLEAKFTYKKNIYTAKFTQIKDKLQIDSVDGLYSNESADPIKFCIEDQLK